MQKVVCPGCGAEVNFLSAASVMAVCGFCKTTVLKDADAIRNIGKMSEVIEDYSPIQITTSGVFQGTGFSVIGRIQLHYDAGFWNEWYVQLDDGNNAWLSDASGQYTFTSEVATPPADLPAFASLSPGKTLRSGGEVCTAADVRIAQCTGGQGELPFVVGGGWKARVADFRSGRKFLTLDYSDVHPGEGYEDQQTALPDEQKKLLNYQEGETKVYSGRAVTLAELKCQLLRGEDQITDSAGRYKGKVGNLECPSCGSPVAFSPGMTSHLVCPACHGEADLSGPKAEVIAAASRVASETKSVVTTLQLGATATIDGGKYTILGVIRRRDTSAEADDPEAQWTEYELYAPGKGFLWLVETVNGWERADVLDEWPSGVGSDEVSQSGAKYKRLYSYPAVVSYAAGSFNWRISVGDSTNISEYSCGIAKLAAEQDEHEITWSRSIAVPANSIRLWFGQEIKADKAQAQDGQTGPYRKLAIRMIVTLFFLNIIPILATDAAALIYSSIAAVLIWLPANYLDKIDPE